MEQRGVKEVPKKELICESCGAKEAKYRCPGCIRRTCSLPCVKKHKKKFNCTGVRCKTTHVAVSDYNDKTMLNDFRLLEDTSRVVYSAVHDVKNKRKHWKRNAVNLLKKATQSGVNLRLMAVGMKKRTENTSYFDNREKCIMWRVRWLFPQAEVEYIDKRLSEKKVLRDLLKKYIDPVEGDPVIRQRLKPYCQVEVDRMSVLFKVENQPANQERFYRLDTSKTLQQCLEHKTVVEYPVLHVVMPDSYPTQAQSVAAVDS